MIDFTEKAEILKIGSFFAKIEHFLKPVQSENEWFCAIFDTKNDSPIFYTKEFLKSREECIEKINLWIKLLYF